MKFRDRAEAGQVLARRLAHYTDRPGVIVLALPRGGVPVGFEVAKALRCPLDIFLVRKLGVPGQEELAMGAIASGGVVVVNDDVRRSLSVSQKVIDRVAAVESEELARRERLYRDRAKPVVIRNQTVILVDDGLATGSTMRAAVQGVRAQGPERIVVAVPAGARETCAQISREVEEVICATTPEPFYAVGLWYEDFSQTTDEEVRTLLAAAAGRQDG